MRAIQDWSKKYNKEIKMREFEKGGEEKKLEEKEGKNGMYLCRWAIWKVWGN